MHTLLAKPVGRCAVPPYPTKLAVLAMPELLARHQPDAWLSNRDIAALGAALPAANLAGCRPPPRMATPIPTASTPTLAAGAPQLARPRVDGPSASGRRFFTDEIKTVAPVFVHGEGRGTTGCIVVSPPVFLSEEEALQVIVEALRGYGLDLSERNVELRGIRIPRPGHAGPKTGSLTTNVPADDSCAFRVDRFDPQRHVAVEFASHDDFFTVGGPWRREACKSTVITFDLRAVADFIVAQARPAPTADALSSDDQFADGFLVEDAQPSAGGCYWGVFYDPVTHRRDGAPPSSPLDRDEYRRALERGSAAAAEVLRAHWDEERRQAKVESERLLRLQVKDFIEWLQAQGVF